MALETILKAYLMLYWPETGPLSKTTMLDFKLATVQFDETQADESRKVRSYYQDVGIVQIEKPADYVEKNASTAYAFGWGKLQERGVRRDTNICRIFLVRTTHAGLADMIAKYFPHIIFTQYMNGDKNLIYIPLSKGSAALN